MNPIALLAGEYSASLSKLSDVDLGYEIRRVLTAAALPDALSTGSEDMVRACNNECRRRGRLFIYDDAYIEAVYGREFAAQVRARRAVRAA